MELSAPPQGIHPPLAGTLASPKCCQDRNPQASLDTSPQKRTPKACLPGSTGITEVHTQQGTWLARGLRGPWLRAADAVGKPDLTSYTLGPGARLFLPSGVGRTGGLWTVPFLHIEASRMCMHMQVCACACTSVSVCAQGTGWTRRGPSAELTPTHSRRGHVPQTQSARMLGLPVHPD